MTASPPTLPWECDLDFKMIDGCLMIEDNDGCTVALIPDANIYGESIQREHAAFIVTACNAHEEMRAALVEFVTDVEVAGMDIEDNWPDLFETYKRVKAILD